MNRSKYISGYSRPVFDRRVHLSDTVNGGIYCHVKPFMGITLTTVVGRSSCQTCCRAWVIVNRGRYEKV